MGKTTSINLVGRDEFEVIMGVFARSSYIICFSLASDLTDSSNQNLCLLFLRSVLNHYPPAANNIHQSGGPG